MELSRLRTRNISRVAWLSAMAFVALNAVDAVVTVRFMGMFSGGLAGNGELSPHLAFMNPASLVAYKIIIPCVILWVLYKGDKLKLLKPLNIALGVVVSWNMFWLLFV